MSLLKNKTIWFFIFLISVPSISSISQALYSPTREEVLQSYKRKQNLDSLTKESVFKVNILPHWQRDGNGFWYKNVLANKMSEYWWIDVRSGKKEKAFDHDKVAEVVSSILDSTVYANRLPIEQMFYDKEHRYVYLLLKKHWYEVSLKDYRWMVNESGNNTIDINHQNNEPSAHFRSRWERQPVSDSMSPDRRWIAYIKEGNIFIKSKSTGESIQYTNDGDTLKPYGQIQWSPDSKFLVVFHIRPEVEKPVYYILSSEDNTTRGILKSNPYPQPGDPFTSYEMFTIDIAAKRLIKTNTELYDFLDYPWINWRSKDNQYFIFEKADRGHQRYRIIEVNAATGATRNIIDEKTNSFIYESRIFTWYTAETNEIVWTSERDGWNHLYLLDALNGGIKNQITKGNWVVRGIDSIDEKKREVWFTASGMNPGEDPYNIHYYRIGMDGKNLIASTPATASHRISFSPDRKYFIDNYSSPDMPPVTDVRLTANGKLIANIEFADVAKYKSLGIRMPEVFVAKGRDGITDIWGIVCRPSHFDSTKRYPVVENIYAGPQDAYVPKEFMRYGEMQSLAELGFIVVQCDGMGTANRSKAFHDVAWKNLADAGFPDRIRWIKALAKKYNYVDTSRVGLYGTSAGGQNSTAALLFHPEFYKAAVSAAGSHDNRVDKQWWNEQWMGYPVGPHYAEQSNVTNAAKLQGALLLIVGEADTNVPPETTLRVVNALIKAGKTFDFLMVPGMGHSDGGVYGRIKKADFFVKHLLGVEPPDRNRRELDTIK